VFILALSPRAAERDAPSTSTRGLGSSWEVEEVEGERWVKVGLLRSPYEARSRLSYPEAVDHPDQARGGSDKPLRSGPKTYRPLTDHGTNAADHHGGTRLKKWVIGGVKAVIGR
jgi:hypothetical protein